MRVTYWIVFLVIYVGLAFLVPPGDDKPFGEFLRWLFFAGFVVLTWRCFRGAHETDEPRPLWRLTATSGYSYGLALVFSVLSVLPAFGLVVALFYSFTLTDYRWNIEAPFMAIETLAQLVAAVLLFRSAARIRRAGLDPVGDEAKDARIRAQTEAERRPGI